MVWPVTRCVRGRRELGSPCLGPGPRVRWHYHPLPHWSWPVFVRLVAEGGGWESLLWGGVVEVRRTIGMFLRCGRVFAWICWRCQGLLPVLGAPVRVTALRFPAPF